MDKESVIVNIKNSHYDVYIGRGSRWGNPFVISDMQPKSVVLQKYINYFWNSGLIEHIQELEGKVLGCHCKPGSCHGDFLVTVVNNGIKSKEEYDKFMGGGNYG